MLIACSSCAAEYEVPDRLLAAGPRMMRCARCGNQFQAGAAAPPHEAAAAPPEAPSTVPTPLPPLAAPPAPEPTSAAPPRRAPAPPRPVPMMPPATDRVAVLGWIATGITLFGGAAAALANHKAISEAWPPATRLFQALGIG